MNNNGAAVYKISLEVPPGTNHVQPNLKLSYNNQSKNGLLGVGWSLSGLSSISRCSRTIAQDGVKGGINFDINWGTRANSVSNTSSGSTPSNFTFIRTDSRYSKPINKGNPGSSPVTVYYLVKKRD
ncbi:MAG: SpvB/TcaC N-terminal domain-containing protein [Desulforhopalus sp.]